ncbi:MAG: aminotransferase class IV [Bacteroidales bacterium]|nr:aminotransferase class IV [Bacteroidales bacterium]
MHIRTGLYYNLNYQNIEAALVSEQLDNAKTTIYEVLRVHQGVPMFWDAHWIRFQYGLNAIGLKSKFDKKKLEKALFDLIQINQLINCNVRIDAVENNLFVYPIVSYYPDNEAYTAGVKVNLTHTERINPTIKFYRSEWREKRQAEIEKAGVYETLLVNTAGLITEGSHSNVFFIQEQSLFSADESSILSGITRSEILKLASENKIHVIYNQVFEHNYKKYKAAFLCGTSYNILPIREINDARLDVNHPVLKKLQREFNLHFKNEYLRNKNKWSK